MVIECSKCEEKKPRSDYYRHSKAKSGFMSACKECVKAAARAHRLKNIDRVRAYDRKRGQLSHRKKAVAERYKRLYRKSHAIHSKKYRSRYPERRKAHILVGNAIRDGRLIPKNCEYCGHDTNIHAHHEDYSKPLEVIWLCQRCHGRRHREINELKRQGKWLEKQSDESIAA